jgi:hypothetical protein
MACTAFQGIYTESASWSRLLYPRRAFLHYEILGRSAEQTCKQFIDRFTMLPSSAETLMGFALRNNNRCYCDIKFVLYE